MIDTNRLADRHATTAVGSLVVRRPLGPAFERAFAVSTGPIGHTLTGRVAATVLGVATVLRFATIDRELSWRSAR